MKTDSIAKAITESFDYWLAEHSPITVPTLMEDAIRNAFAEWLEKHSAEIIAAIASGSLPERVAKHNHITMTESS